MTLNVELNCLYTCNYCVWLAYLNQMSGLVCISCYVIGIACSVGIFCRPNENGTYFLRTVAAMNCFLPHLVLSGYCDKFVLVYYLAFLFPCFWRGQLAHVKIRVIADCTHENELWFLKIWPEKICDENDDRKFHISSFFTNQKLS